ncbi:MAG: hypothetical protein ACOYBX_06950 [Mycobacterium sp.]|jgi:hypothetical protein
MSRFTKLFAANAIAAAGLGAAAIALSPSAVADPIIPPVPAVPGLGMIQQLASNPAGVGAVLQTAASALSGASSIIGGPAAAPSILGGPAAGTLPVSPIDVTGALPAVPAAAGVAPMIPTQTLGQTVLPLLNQFGIPGSLASLAPSNVPFPIQIGDAAGVAPAGAAVPLTAPAATAQIAVAPPAGGTAISPLPLLNALP